MSTLPDFKNDLSIFAQQINVRFLGTAETAKAIPRLAVYDRRAQSWEQVILGGAARQAVYAGGLILLLITFSVVLRRFITTAYGLVALDFRPSWWFLLTLLLTGGVGYLLTEPRDLLPTLSDMERFPDEWHTVVLRISQSIVAFISLSGLFLTLMPIPIALMTFRRFVFANAYRVREIAEASGHAGIYSVVALGFLALLATIVWLVRRVANDDLEGLIFVLGALWLCGAILWGSVIDASGVISPTPIAVQTPAFFSRLFSNPSEMLIAFDLPVGGQVALWILAIVVAYPAGWFRELTVWPLKLANLSADAFADTREHFELRSRLVQALTAQRNRNRKLTGDIAWSTVCRQHLRRFVYRSERLSYGQWIRYACCPVCGEDIHAVTNLKTRTLRLDIGMSESRKHEGASLHLNGLKWMRGDRDWEDAGTTPTPIDALVIGRVPEIEIDAFLIAYHKQARVRPLHTLFGCVEQGSAIDSGTANQLRDELRHLRNDYQLNQPACSPSALQQLQTRDTVSRAQLFGVNFIWSAVVFALWVVLFRGAWWVWQQFPL